MTDPAGGGAGVNSGDRGSPWLGRTAARLVAMPPWAWAILCGAAGFLVALRVMHRPERPGDFLYWYTAAQALLDGVSPYQVIPAIDPVRFETGFFYPLPAAILTVPFAVLPYALAGALFVGLSSAALGYGIAREGKHRLWVFASAPFIVSAASGTWSLPLAAAALLPALGFLAVAKPNVGLATFLARPSWRLVIGSLGVVALSLLIRPTWPAEWLDSVQGVRGRVVPLLTPAGPLLLLALTRWRRPETRLLLGYACIPQAPWFYDQIILWLIPATVVEAQHYTVVSQLAMSAWMLFGGEDWRFGHWFLAAVLYLPPLIMILKRPNEGTAAAWIEALAARTRPRLPRRP